jgi:hypothetical protein
VSLRHAYDDWGPMTAETEYFALLWDGDDVAAPRTVLRRRPTPEGPVGEILRADGSWESTGILVLAQMNMYEHDVVPITASAALDFERWVEARRSSEAGDDA